MGLKRRNAHRVARQFRRLGLGVGRILIDEHENALCVYSGNFSRSVLCYPGGDLVALVRVGAYVRARTFRAPWLASTYAARGL